MGRVVRALRALVLFGPWRHLAIWLIRQLRPPLPAQASAGESLLPEIDVEEVVETLRKDGVCVVGQMAAPALERLRMVTDRLPLAEYTHFHEHNAEVRALVEDEVVLAVLRRYLRAEPVLLECSVVVHEPRPEIENWTGQIGFHFDYGGWQSLNLFVYLSDVDVDSGAHEVAIGTHRTKSFRDAIRHSLEDDEAAARFTGRIRTIKGPAGTIFFENTEAFHRRGPVHRRRVMANLLYASHRGFLSKGRPGMRYARYLSTIDHTTGTQPHPGHLVGKTA